jgi:superoxide reductase
LVSKDLKTKIEGAIRTYNRYRSPEVTAELQDIQDNGEKFVVSFRGTFCRTCGFYDYFEDLVYEILDETEIQTRILKVKEEWDTEGFTVTYLIEK